MKKIKKSEYTLWEKVCIFLWYRPKSAIQNFFFDLKNRSQRFVRGYADLDYWGGIDCWFSTIGAKLFRELSENTVGYPPGLTLKKWKTILNEIAEGLDIAHNVIENDAIFDTDLEKMDEEAKTNYLDPKSKTKIVPRKKYDKAMKLFVKYYFNFWN